jgi:hypothetical protein
VAAAAIAAPAAMRARRLLIVQASERAFAWSSKRPRAPRSPGSGS